MNKTTKRIITLLLAFILAVVPSIAVLSSCNKTTDDDKKQGDDIQNDGERAPNIPDDLKFEGKTFSIWCGSAGKSIIANEETGDIINDLTYQRNKDIESRFGVKLNFVDSGFETDGGAQSAATDTIRYYIQANDNTYQAYMQVQHSGMPVLINDHFFIDWNELPYVDLTEPWWYRNILDDITFGNKVYTMTGDYANYISEIDVLLFNKDIFDELGLEYPYQDVKDGTWTWDKFAELVNKGAKDLNGDGQMDPKEDRWGLAGWGYELDFALVLGLGYQPLVKDENQMPILNSDMEKSNDIYQKVVDLFKDGKHAHSEFQNYGLQMGMFSQGRTMFYDCFMAQIPYYSEVEFDFGIVPFPKADKDSEYVSRSSNMTGLTYVPVTNNDLEMTGAILEEMAYRSYKDITPVYFDTVLTVRNTRDEESAEMLPIIRDSATLYYDGFAPSIIGMVKAKNNTFSADYAANLSTYQKNLDGIKKSIEAPKY